MGFLSRMLGICQTAPPRDSGCWVYNKGTLTVDLGRAPELKSKGGAIRLEASGLPARVLVLHGDDGQYHAFVNKCTHAGRRLDPLPGQGVVECCSVGKSKFKYNGELVSGSAKKPASTLPLKAGNGTLTIDLSSAAG